MLTYITHFYNFFGFLDIIFSFFNSVETFAVARNVEDLAAAKITPMIPAEALAPLSRETFSSKISRIASSLVGGMVSLAP